MKRCVIGWVESPYFQYFCGEDYFQHRLPIDRSSMSRWRKRVGDGFFTTLIQESLSVAYESKTLKLNHVKRVVVDTTVQPKAVSFPTDVKLRYRALLALVKLAKQHDLPLRQSYVRVAKKALMMSGRYRHAKQLKRARRVEKFLQVRLERVLPDTRRQLKKPQYQALRSLFAQAIRKAWIAYRQTKIPK